LEEAYRIAELLFPVLGRGREETRAEAPAGPYLGGGSLSGVPGRRTPHASLVI
jgi:hypothetical protein